MGIWSFFYLSQNISLCCIHPSWDDVRWMQCLCDDMQWNEWCKQCDIALGCSERVTWMQTLQYLDRESDNPDDY